MDDALLIQDVLQIRFFARVSAQRRAVVDDTRMQVQLNGRGRRGRHGRFRRLCRRHLGHFRRSGHLRRCRRFGRRGFGRYRGRRLSRRGRFRRFCRRGRRRIGARFRIVDGSDIRRFLFNAHQLDIIGHHVAVAAVGANIAPIAFTAHDPNHRTGRKPRDFLAIFVRLFTERNLSARIVAIVVDIALRQLLRNGFRRRGGRGFCRRFGRRGLNRRDGRLRRLNGSLRFLLRNEADVVALYISGIAVGHVANQIPELSVFARCLRGNLQRRRAADRRNRAARRVRRVGRGAQNDERILLNRHGISRERQLAGLLDRLFRRLLSRLFRRLLNRLLNRLLSRLFRRLLRRLLGRLFGRFGRRFHARQKFLCFNFRNRRHKEIAHIAGHAVADNRHIVPAVIDNLVDEQQLAVRIFAQNGGSRAIHLAAQIVGFSAARVVGHGILRRRLHGFFRRNRRFFDGRLFRRDRRLDNRFFRRNRRFLDNRLFRGNRRLNNRLFRRNWRLDNRFFRRDRGFLRFGGFGIDLRHQNLSGGFINARHLFGNDPSLFHRAIVRNPIPEAARFVKHIAVDEKHIARIQDTLGVPFIRIKEEHRLRLVDRRIQRHFNRRLCRGFFRRNRRLDNRFFRGNRRLDDRLFRRSRCFLRFGGFGIDLRHQNLSGGFINARHLFGNDPSLFHRAIVRNPIPEAARFVKHIAVDEKHIARIQDTLGVPFIRIKEEHRLRLVDRRIQRHFNRRLCRGFFRGNRRLDNRLFRGNRRLDNRFFRRNRRLDDRLFRRNRRFDDRLFRRDRRLDDRLFRRNRRFFNRLFRRSRRFKAELAQHGIGFLLGHRCGIAGTHERQSGSRIERISHRYRVIQRVIQSRSDKGHFAVNFARIRHQPELCVRKRGTLCVAEHTVVNPVDRAAQRRRYRGHIQAELAAILQRNDDLNRQPCAFGRRQLLSLRHRRGQQHGAERESRHPADESLHHDCILLFR